MTSLCLSNALFCLEKQIGRSLLYSTGIVLAVSFHPLTTNLTRQVGLASVQALLQSSTIHSHADIPKAATLGKRKFSDDEDSRPEKKKIMTVRGPACVSMGAVQQSTPALHYQTFLELPLLSSPASGHFYSIPNPTSYVLTSV